MSELIEHEINRLNGQAVVVVRPGFGTQSDSWTGLISSQTNAYPLQFHFQSVGQSIIFTADDVVKVEMVKSNDDHSARAIIRLKGPVDYIPHYTSVEA